MPMDVCQAFLHETKYSEFYLRGKPTEVVGNIQFNTKAAALRQTLCVPPECGCQSTFVSHWWVQKIRRRAYLLGQILNQILDIFDAFRHSRRVTLRVNFDSRKAHP